ncbi:hypothetical protein BpHYR1_046819 [Brachionus plicatilis]|uniref:Uncharacterized protein n=1 Tax=Brachionus plicatilis TaxID=10195 RepID=A0A3M7PFJ3_BRAPC|nr:hypothetical protein BpHYR1_046819 [Brachionus plicatilis]
MFKRLFFSVSDASKLLDEDFRLSFPELDLLIGIFLNSFWIIYLSHTNKQNKGFNEKIRPALMPYRSVPFKIFMNILLRRLFKIN